VGKSTLFNKIVGGRPAIVDDTPGVTRDRNIAFASRDGRRFGVIDTGGFEPENMDEIVAQTREQALVAIEEADQIYFVVDGREGLRPSDEELVRSLRKSGKPARLVVNKIDSQGMQAAADEFYRLGFGKVYPISAEHSLGVEALLEETVAEYPPDPEPVAGEDRPIRVAVVGRPNVGKSSLVNKLLGRDRMIVSQVAGTTRDAVDSEVELTGGRKYTLVDTAGIRRKSKVSQRLEKYSVIMAMKAVERADVVALMADAAEGVSTQEAKIAGLVEDAGKGLILVINKWDLLVKETDTAKKFEEEARNKLKFVRRAPMIFISALSGQRVEKLWDLVDQVHGQLSRRVTSGALNVMMKKILAQNPPPTAGGRPIRIYYATQVSSAPPTFVIMTNSPEGIHFSYRRYLENRIREEAGFEMAPLRFIFRKPSGRRTGPGEGHAEHGGQGR
jgi:GTP-binding protein